MRVRCANIQPTSEQAHAPHFIFPYQALSSQADLAKKGGKSSKVVGATTQLERSMDDLPSSLLSTNIRLQTLSSVCFTINPFLNLLFFLPVGFTPGSVQKRKAARFDSRPIESPASHNLPRLPLVSLTSRTLYKSRYIYLSISSKYNIDREDQYQGRACSEVPSLI